MTVPPEVITAAAKAYRTGRDGRPAEGWLTHVLEAAAPLIAAAERARLRRVAGGRKRTLTRPAIDNGPAEALEVVLWRDLADLLDGDAP